MYEQICTDKFLIRQGEDSWEIDPEEFEPGEWDVSGIGIPDGYEWDKHGNLYDEDGNFLGNYIDDDGILRDLDGNELGEATKTGSKGDIQEKDWDEAERDKKEEDQKKEPKTIQYEIITEGEGTTTGAGNYQVGDTAVLVANPATGWKFKEWQEHFVGWTRCTFGTRPKFEETVSNFWVSEGQHKLHKAIFEEDSSQEGAKWQEIEREAEQVYLDSEGNEVSEGDAAVTLWRTTKSTFERQATESEDPEKVPNEKMTLHFDHSLVGGA